MRSLYHCFGCQASGDAFKFVMETEGLDFASALESLAQRFGVEIEAEAEDPEAASRRQRRERLWSLLERAAVYYARYLWEAAEAAPAREYLLGRELREETLREFRVGYAPSAWDRMLLASRRAGFSDDELLAVGLAQRSQSRPGQIYDRFRERIMFPSVERPREGRRVRGASDARQPTPQVPQHRRQRPLPQARAAVRDQPGALGGGALGADDAGRGLHRRARGPPGGAVATRSGSWAPR